MDAGKISCPRRRGGDLPAGEARQPRKAVTRPERVGFDLIVREEFKLGTGNGCLTTIVCSNIERTVSPDELSAAPAPFRAQDTHFDAC